MTTNYIISQIFVICAMLCLGISYLCKNKTKIMILCIFCSIFYAGQYFLLGAMTGVAMNVVSIIRNILFYINSNKNKQNNILVLIVLWLIVIISGIITFDNIFSLVPILATLIFTYSVWQDSTKIYRWLALPISALWITYNISVKSIFGIICELILLTFEIIGVIKISKKLK